MSTAKVRHIRVGGFTTRYLESGDENAPLLLLLHDGAWGGASDVTWGRCIPLFAERYRIIAPDFLGFGGSDKVTFFDRSSYEPRMQQLKELVTALRLATPIHVVGSSYGGSVALRLLAEKSFPLASVTSIGGSGGPWKTDVMAAQLGRWDGSRLDLARILSFLMDEGDASFQDQLSIRQFWAQQPGHYRSVLSAALPIPAALRVDVSDVWPQTLQGVTVPTLLIAGEEDTLFEPEWPERIAAELSQSAIVRMNTLHSPNLDHPAEVVEIVTRFIESHALDALDALGSAGVAPR
ncbi:MAG: alpha/beta hydrolase fold protein [Homoserinimonas sp.]|nr:alpha/beta hydrolase fold protein [Homoserinimonas sp.]